MKSRVFIISYFLVSFFVISCTGSYRCRFITASTISRTITFYPANNPNYSLSVYLTSVLGISIQNTSIRELPSVNHEYYTISSSSPYYIPDNYNITYKREALNKVIRLEIKIDTFLLDTLYYYPYGYHSDIYRECGSERGVFFPVATDSAKIIFQKDTFNIRYEDATISVPIKGI